MAWSARILATNALYQIVEQNAHGFVRGDVLRFDGVSYIKAQSDTEANAEVVGMVSAVKDANTFYITQTGYVYNLASTPENPGGNYVAGTLYYLSPAVAGKLTATKPTTVGQVELPCFIANTTTSGYFFASVGTLIESGSLFAWNIVASDTSMASNNGYALLSFVSRDFLLPPTANTAVGDVLKVAVIPALPVALRITQNANQNITLADRTTTTGVAGRLDLLPTSGTLLGTIDMVCLAAGLTTQWVVMAGTGSWDVI